jgi:biotin transport system substrate-specific component
MSSLSLASNRSTLADRLFARSIVTDSILVLAGVALTAALAQVSIPLWPVPITGQTLAVLLVGSFLGAARGSISMLLYAVLGVIGLPIFAAGTSGWGVIASPSGGYIIGFIFAAGLTGWAAQRTWDRRFIGAAVSFFAGSAVVFVFGLPWLAFSLGLNLQQTLQAGLYPFIVGGIIKAVIAAGVISTSWYFVDRKNARRSAE